MYLFTSKRKRRRIHSDMWKAADGAEGLELLEDARHVLFGSVDVPRDIMEIIFAYYGYHRMGLDSVGLVDNMWRTVYLSSWDCLRVSNQTFLREVHPFVIRSIHTLDFQCDNTTIHSDVSLVLKMDNLLHIRSCRQATRLACLAIFTLSSEQKARIRTIDCSWIGISTDWLCEFQRLEVLRIGWVKCFKRNMMLTNPRLTEVWFRLPLMRQESTSGRCSRRVDEYLRIAAPLLKLNVPNFAWVHSMNCDSLQNLEISTYIPDDVLWKSVFPSLQTLTIRALVDIPYARVFPTLSHLCIQGCIMNWGYLEWPLAHCKTITVKKLTGELTILPKVQSYRLNCECTFLIELKPWIDNIMDLPGELIVVYHVGELNWDRGITEARAEGREIIKRMKLRRYQTLDNGGLYFIR